MKLMVLDGNSLVNRAFFGIKLLTTKDGRYTNAIYGFQNILLNLLAAHKPDAVAIAWDERAPTFRHTAYDGYKATRHGMPEELAQQMPVLKELLTDLGFVQVSKAGWEADDILGTLAAACEAAGGTTLLATGDRDSLQLVDDATTVLLATNKETIPMDPAAIREKYGIEPPQLIDVKSLMGDASDNIPGVPGIGEKTALALISKFGSLQAVYDNIDDKAVKPGQRAKLTANRDKADLSYMLGTIRKDAPIETDPAAYLRQPGDPAAAAQLLAEGKTLPHPAGELIVTPHPGEMARLTGLSVAQINADRENTACQYAEKWNAVVVLKGCRTVVAAPDGRVCTNSTGNPGLARGGSGDVLAGMTAALLACGLPAYEAAACAVYLHGAAADRAAAALGEYGMLPHDILSQLGRIFAENHR